MFSRDDSLAGIDLDDCLDEHDGVKPWACGVVERFADTYMEISPSGGGLKVWARGSLPANLGGVKVGQPSNRDVRPLALRFAGGHWPRVSASGAPFQVEDHAADLRALYDRLTAGRKEVATSASVGDGQIPLRPTAQHVGKFLRNPSSPRCVRSEAIEAFLQIVNEKQCEKPGPRENVTRIVRSSRKWGKQ